ncbi:MAG: shikimate kinase [Alphaproteobacteria bacterium]|nr:shikimate kinase [Alphaproteobacteria bacterium]
MSKTFDQKIGGAKPLVLIGMMGVGKTTIGQALAEHWGCLFVDSDREIERRAHRSVAQIFAEEGEDAFRRMERDVIAALLDRPPCVVSLGGGAFLDEATRQSIQEKALSVWLKASPEILSQRLGDLSSRPLLAGSADPLKTISALLAARSPFYALADLAVTCGAPSVATNAQAVIAALQAAQAPQTERG